jgi:hypothetical protein
MRMISPNVGLPEITVAEDQHEYLTLTAALVEWDDGSRGILTRWRLTHNEKERVANGEDLYITVLTFGQPLQPIAVVVGEPDYVRKENDL